MYVQRANNSQGEEREVYISLALRQIDDTVMIRHFESQMHTNACRIGALFSKSMVLGELRMYKDVVDTADEFLSLCSNTQYDGIEEDWIIARQGSRRLRHIWS